MVNRSMQGVVHGRTIHLSEDPGIADGQQVQIVVLSVASSEPWGDGIRRSAGAAADVSGFDEAFRQVERDRKTN